MSLNKIMISLYVRTYVPISSDDQKQARLYCCAASYYSRGQKIKVDNSTHCFCFRETQADELLERARTMFSDHFSSAVNFQPSSLLIVTWDDVGYFDRKSDKVFTNKLPPGTRVAPDERVFYCFMYACTYS